MAFDVGYPLDVRLSWTDAIGSQHRDQSLMPGD